MTAEILQGEPVAREIRDALRADLERLKPRVVAVHNEDSPAARPYRRMQERLCDEAHVKYEVHPINASTKLSAIEKLVDKLNADKTVTGITIHLPLPAGLPDTLMERVDPRKDIEGTHPYNLGRLTMGEHWPSPCAATAAVEILRRVRPSCLGLEATIVGRSAMVGRPIVNLLLHSKTDAPTPTICHTATRDLGSHTRRADILFAAAGRAGLVTAPMVKAGAVVIDIGTNRLPSGKYVGDVTDDVREVAAVVTPVPGGVGPVTLAILLKNIVMCAKQR